MASLLSLTQSMAPCSLVESQPMTPVMVGLSQEIRSVTPPTRVAWRLPAAPSRVVVDLAAACAVSEDPSWRTASLNSWAVISPAVKASRKFPV